MKGDFKGYESPYQMIPIDPDQLQEAAKQFKTQAVFARVLEVSDGFFSNARKTGKCQVRHAEKIYKLTMIDIRKEQTQKQAEKIDHVKNTADGLGAIFEELQHVELTLTDIHELLVKGLDTITTIQMVQLDNLHALLEVWGGKTKEISIKKGDES